MASEQWQVAPVLVVRDMAASLAYWRDCMGFAVIDTFKNPPVMAFMGRRGVQFMLRQTGGDPIPGTNRAYIDSGWDAHVWIDDADALHAEMKARGATVSELCEPFYNNREFEVTDPDGYIIAFGSEVRPG
jgi:catechol 2,3-dioxygenase-like lactoylglutathione lyase family enzyme